MTTNIVSIVNPKGFNLILGSSHFIKTVEDIQEIMATTNPLIKYGIAFCEASQDRLIRHAGNDITLRELAIENAQAIGAGHSFIIFLDNGFPINVLNPIKQCMEVVRIFCATANPVQVLVAETDQGRGILGVIDGFSPLGVENEDQIAHRKEFLRKIGYKN